MRVRILTFLTVLALLSTPSPAVADDAVSRGPSTTTNPYVLPVADGVRIISILTVNDPGAARNGYEMVGIPDGIGLTIEGGTVVAFMNHELRSERGIVRRHGQTGAFVSRLVIDPTTLAVTHGSDLIDPGVRFWDYVSDGYVTTGARFADGTPQDLRFSRFCSGTLSDPGIFDLGAFGDKGQIYFANEEAGDNGRLFGVLTDGTTQALPRLGLFSWENTVPANNTSRTTLVMGQEDGPGPGPAPTDGSQLWVYVGTKQNSGDPFARAGLTNGLSHVIDAVDPAVTDDPSWRAAYPKGVAAPVTLREVGWDQTGAAQNVEAKSKGLSLNRIEDGHWDPRHRNDFYFLTTEGGDRTTSFPFTRDGGGLWRLSWQDIDRPELGATLTLLLDGSEEIAPGEPKMNKPDNVVIDHHGNLLIQEDPGNNAHLARIIAYRLRDGAMGVVARFDPARFALGGASFMTQDEESSGIVDAEKILGKKGTFLFDAQVHTAAGLPAGTGPNTVQEYVEHGQLLVLRVDKWKSVYSAGDANDDKDDDEDD